MIDEIQKLVDEYWGWLRDKTALRRAGDRVEITTPYLDRHNDYLQIYVRRENGDFVITDEGDVIDDLEMSGCDVGGGRRREMLEVTLNGFGVRRNGNALEVQATAKDFCLRKHNLVQAMLAVDDLFYTARSAVANLFNEDVAGWMDSADIRYSPRLKISGKSGYDHFFDFVIPKSKGAPERMLRAINSPGRSAAENAIFLWEDIQKMRGADSRFYVFLNDADNKEGATPSAKFGKLRAAMENYNLRPVCWTERDKIRPELAA